MEKFIDKISTTIPFTEERVDIELNGKNLIITGANGSGKTSLVDGIYKKLVDIVRSKKLDQLPQWRQNKEHWAAELEKSEKGSAQYQQAERQLEITVKNIESVIGDPNITINNHLEFSRKVDSELGIIELFTAVRQSQIQDARSASGTNYNKGDLANQRPSIQLGDQLEQHLVNLYTRRSFSITEKRNPELEVEITNWLKEFDKNLKFLMEDDSVHLSFDADNFKFFIQQKGKFPYTFQNLSSGYSSIFSVFSKLLMRSEYLKISPSKLCGVAIIDEIDAHLHVTLQRKILPFLSESFPGIQYIVTTHSPFVLTSVSNSEIYDISRREQVGELSSYSYESVLEGLFDVSPSSDILKNKIRKIAREIERDDVNIEMLKELVSDIGSDSSYLDEESKFYLNSAKLEIKKYHKGAGN
ncbi:AAA family ATPase [Vreelandella hamiltonii]|uniref:ATPase AAA n=1 Tax=Vreelandella hamiltonii TaxID=502829 RepID=A0A8H9I530_9GAMM|nr:AAA family ATPase [Halomonas hamiltonii]GGW35198.1 ATPase AAA [Halomonas hamiltonii]